MSTSPEPPGIPAELYARLDPARPQLETQGAIERRRGHDRPNTYRLRYRVHDSALGCTVQRCILLGDEATASAVQALLDRWRLEFKRREKARALAARIESAHERAKRDLYRRIAQRFDDQPLTLSATLRVLEGVLGEAQILLMHAPAAARIVGTARLSESN